MLCLYDASSKRPGCLLLQLHTWHNSSCDVISSIFHAISTNYRKGSNGVVIKPTWEHPPVIVLAGVSSPMRSLIPYVAVVTLFLNQTSRQAFPWRRPFTSRCSPDLWFNWRKRMWTFFLHGCHSLCRRWVFCIIRSPHPSSPTYPNQV